MGKKWKAQIRVQLSDIWQKCQKHTLKKIQYFQQMELGNLDIHIGKIGITPSGSKAST